MTTSYERAADYGYGSVRTRISWGAILAGVSVAMAIYALLMSLGIAIGMSVSDDVNSRTLGTGAGVWGFIALLIALFSGGWVTTQVTIGESRTEALLYGVVLWATTSVLLLWLTANGVQASMNTAMAIQNTNRGNQSVSSIDDSRVDNAQNAEDRQINFDRVRQIGREGSWWAFAGILLSMVAAIGGALVGPIELTLRRDTRYRRDEHSTRDLHNPPTNPPTSIRDQHTPIT